MSTALAVSQLAPSAPPFLWPALETMVRIRRQRRSGVFLFAAPHARAGTSHVVGLLANELTQEFGQCVMIASSASLRNPSTNNAPRGCLERSPNVWVPIAESELDSMPKGQLTRVGLGFSPESFDFILVDCPSLNSGRRSMRLGVAADGAFLIVEAGRTKLDEIENARRFFQAGSVHLEGVILNRRTYAIPKAVYSIL